MIQTVQHYSAIDYLQSNETTQIQEKIIAILKAMDEENKDLFLEKIQEIDLNSYFGYDDDEVLISCFLIGYAVNPDLKEGDFYIRTLLDRNPDLTLPVMKESYPYANLREAIEEELKDLKERGSWIFSEKELQIIVNRVQLVIDYLDQPISSRF